MESKLQWSSDGFERSSGLWAILCLLLALAFAASPLLTPDFGGFDADQFPVPQNDPPVQPAGYAFAIWGVIYLWLIIGMGFGVIKRRHAQDWDDMRKPLSVSLAIGCVWLPVALISPVWATILIWGMLFFALIALFRAPRDDKPWAILPVGLYAGWLSAASCVSLGLMAAGYGWMGELPAALIAIFIALVLASAIQSTLNRAPTYGLGVIWALVAVVVSALGDTATVAAIAAGGAAALIIPTYKSWRDG